MLMAKDLHCHGPSSVVDWPIHNGPAHHVWTIQCANIQGGFAIKNDYNRQSKVSVIMCIKNWVYPSIFFRIAQKIFLILIHSSKGHGSLLMKIHVWYIKMSGIKHRLRQNKQNNEWSYDYFVMYHSFWPERTPWPFGAYTSCIPQSEEKCKQIHIESRHSN